MRASLKTTIGAMFDPRGTLRADPEAPAMAEHLVALFAALKIDLVIDIGADRGQFGNLLRTRAGYRGRIASFEPIPSLFTALETRTSRDDAWTVEHAALGERSGSLPLNIIDLQDFRPPSTKSTASGRSTTRFRRESVPVLTLDEAANRLRTRYQARRLFINLNATTQDRDILHGGEATLAKAAAMRTQLSTTRKSEGMPHYLAMLSYFEAKRFSPQRFFPTTTPPGFICCLVNADLACKEGQGALPPGPPLRTHP